MEKHKLFLSTRKSDIISENGSFSKNKDDNDGRNGDDDDNDVDDEDEDEDEENRHKNNEEKKNNNSSDISSLEDEDPEKNCLKNKTACIKVQAESDSDSDSPVCFFSSSNCAKLPYTFQEDEEILKFILKGQNIFKTSSLSIWKHLESKKVKPKRTYQSLKNRFLRNIKPKIFSTFQHLIKDEQTIRMVLTKFPELKKEYDKRHTFKHLNLNIEKRILKSSKEGEPSSSKKTCFVNSHRDVNVKIEVKQASSTPLKFSEPIADLTAEENAISKTVEFKNGEIVVTVKYNQNVNSKSFQRQGIYEKYLRLKQKNVIVPCFHCGRGSPFPDKFEDNVSDSDSDIIMDSHEPNENDVSGKTSSKANNKSDSSSLKRRKKVDEKNTTQSPNISEESGDREEVVEERVNPTPEKSSKASKQELSPKYSKSSGYHLRTGTKDSCSDEEIDLLYRKIMNSCSTYNCSYESDCSDVKSQRKSKLTASVNGGTRFKHPEYSTSSSASFSSCVEPSKKTAELSTGISEDIARSSKVTLFKNMVKMFGKNFRKKIKSSLSEAEIQKN